MSRVETCASKAALESKGIEAKSNAGTADRVFKVLHKKEGLVE